MDQVKQVSETVQEQATLILEEAGRHLQEIEEVSSEGSMIKTETATS